MAIEKKLIHFNKDEKFQEEKEAGNIKDTSIIFTGDKRKIYTHDEEYKTVTWRNIGKPDPFNGQDYVDMGEAGIWATCNVGANSPEEYGLYFAWGETQGYTNPNGDKKFSLSDYKFNYNNPTKYNSTDNLTVLELEDDAAHVNMGGDWRMPTVEEFIELKNLCNSEWTTDYNGTGVKGRIFKLKTDESKQLFFPAAGQCDSTYFYGVGSLGKVWSSSLIPIKTAKYLSFERTLVDPQNNYGRYSGLSVRGFIPKQS